MFRNFRRLVKFSSIKEKIKKERNERLKQREATYFPTLTNDKQEFIRNFGIIAHIDAGKTTTTERMLYYAGALPQPGEVHEGTTVMDYMPQERQRGITIRSAAISFNWNDFQYNLIDTPGHIDFTAEVERSLRVLDGAVAIFDGVSGVETQSETVWFQANKFNIPRIAFVNKMDRQGASLEYTVESMKDRLNITPLVLQYPLGESESFQGVIDLIDLKIITWTDKLGNIVNVESVTKDHNLYSKIMQHREILLENIANLDDEFAENYLEGNEMQKNVVNLAIRRVLTNNPLNVCPVLVGSALKNKGVQPLLDAVNQFLPSPLERPPVRDSAHPDIVRQLNSKEKLCAYTYKIVHDQELGNLAYTRIYSGLLESKANILNSTLQQQERINNIYRVRANKYVPIPEAQAGDIVAIQGLRDCLSGCTLNSPTDPPFILSQLEMPPCVFFAQLEYESMKDKAKLDSALDILQQEDTSLKITQDEAGQIVIGGLGELHLEIVQQRLKEDFNLRTTLKKMQVEYKESIQDEYLQVFTYNETINNRPLWFNLKIKLIPLELEETQENEVIFDFQRPQEFDVYYKEFKLRLIKKKVSKEQTPSKDSSEKLNEDLAHFKNFLRYIRNPCSESEVGFIQDTFGEEKIFSIESLPFTLLYELENQLKSALSRGPLLSYPIIGVRACIVGGQYTSQRTTEVAVGRCVQKIVAQSLDSAQPIILEPVMNIEISTPNNVMQSIMNDLIAVRRGRVKQVDEDKSRFGKTYSNRTLIQGSIPLQETIGYSTYIRSVSQGEANFVMSFHKYEYVGGVKQNQILQGDF